MKFTPRQVLVAFCGWMILSATAIATAQEAEKPIAEVVAEKPTARFIRVERNDDNQPKTLQTSIVSYQAADGKGDVVVDLVGAVHVGDKSYYDELNRRFKDYDVVLYELVAPKENAVPRRGEPRGANPVSFLQDMTKSMLELESQMEHVDYTPDNFVHADMSPAEMQAAMKKRGEDGMTLALGVMADMMRQANLAEQKAKDNPDAEEVNPLALLFDANRSLKLKRMMAENFTGTDDLEGGLGPTMQRMLVDDRNSAAMKVFQKELAKGHKKIAIFYGAAHMPDFEKRLAADFGMKPTKTQWLTAWKMNGSNMGGGAKEDPLQDLLKLLEKATQ